MKFLEDISLPRWLWSWATDPLFKIADETEKRQAQLLAGLTLLIAAIIFFWIYFLANFVPDQNLGTLDTVLRILATLTLFAHLLSRTRYHRAGAYVFVWSWSAGSYFMAAGNPQTAAGIINPLLAFTFITASALLTLPALALLTVANLAAFFFLRFIIPGLTAVDAYSIAGVSGVIAVLVFILDWFHLSVENRRLREIEEINTDLQKSNLDLQESRSTLEQNVEERTRELALSQKQSERRSRQFEGITRVSRAIIQTTKLYDLLPQITRVISEQFNFYHVGIFLTGGQGQYAILSAANSEGGKRMLARKHQLKIGEQGIVGYVTGSGRPRIALDVGSDAVYFNNPDLPLTHSEMALPLKIGDEVIGALDIQSTERNAFTDDDIEVLSSLADQVSLAIQNARLFDQTEKLISESNAIQRQYLRDTWRSLPKEQKLSGFRYTIAGAMPLVAGEDAGMLPEKGAFSLPISLRGEKIGTLAIQLPEGTKVTPDQRDLIQAVADRVALSAENARLFDETQKRATQLESLNEMGRMVSQQIELKAVLLSAYEQLRRIIQLDAYIIALYNEEKRMLNYPLIIDEGVEYESADEHDINPENSTGKVILTGKPILTLVSREEYETGARDGMLGNENKPSASLMYIPLTLGQRTIGVLSIQSYSFDAYSQSQVALVENIANQLSIAIQNARLFEETRRRAERERVISDIAAKIGASVRTESILKTTAQELSQFLQGAEIMIKLQADETPNRAAPNS